MPKGVKVRQITAQQDEIIRQCWRHNTYGHHAAQRAAQLTGLTVWVVARRARELGLIFTRERYRWTEPELRVVEENAHLSLETIQRKLRLVSPDGVRRTRAAIANQIHAQRLRSNLNGLDHGQLAEALGISQQRLHHLRGRGAIKGVRLESLRQACGYAGEILDENRPWFYHNADIVRFLFDYRGEINLRKVNQVWLFGLLESFITLLQPTEKELREAERERSKLAQRRRRKTMSPSIATSPRRQSGDEGVARRAGRRLLNSRLITGEAASPPRVSDGGESSNPFGAPSASASDVSAPAKLPSISRSSGTAGGLNAA